MRIVNFLGGLGNQMFVYALYRYLERTFPGERIYGCYRSGSLDVHGGLELERVFNLRLPESRPLTDAFSRIYVLAKRLGLTRWENDREFTRWDVVFDGYWLDRHFYSDVDVSSMFRFRTENLSEDCLRMLGRIRESRSVALHVRRGDYMEGENFGNFGRYCTEQYYHDAIRRMETLMDGATYYIFSDDQEWAKEHIRPDSAVYVDINRGRDNWADMLLMSECKANIIANSTFSYWAAMLNRNGGAVVCPRKWYRWDDPDIFPDSWIRL